MKKELLTGQILLEWVMKHLRGAEYTHVVGSGST